LSGPTGEHNEYRLHAKAAVLCCARNQSELLYQLATVLAVESRAVWLAPAAMRALLLQLPIDVQPHVDVIHDMADASWQAVLMHGDSSEVIDMAERLAQHPGAVVPLQALPAGWYQPGAFAMPMLVSERSVSTNTAAAGGNASLMMLD
jgi:RHH-type proline utilization regulon transcriptional repressor/proline dehydrogenase/delta 1-pyrroline-5-carboxylate dehydrogenase